MDGCGEVQRGTGTSSYFRYPDTRGVEGPVSGRPSPTGPRGRRPTRVCGTGPVTPPASGRPEVPQETSLPPLPENEERNPSSRPFVRGLGRHSISDTSSLFRQTRSSGTAVSGTGRQRPRRHCGRPAAYVERGLRDALGGTDVGIPSSPLDQSACPLRSSGLGRRDPPQPMSVRRPTSTTTSTPETQEPLPSCSPET